MNNVISIYSMLGSLPSHLSIVIITLSNASLVMNMFWFERCHGQVNLNFPLITESIKARSSLECQFPLADCVFLPELFILWSHLSHLFFIIICSKAAVYSACSSSCEYLLFQYIQRLRKLSIVLFFFTECGYLWQHTYSAIRCSVG